MINNNLITKEFRKQGVSLREPDDHVLEIVKDGQVLARFSQSGATVENILKVSEHVQEGVN